MSGSLYCSGEISILRPVDSNLNELGFVIPTCSDQWQAMPPFEFSQLDPAVMGQMFAVGFALIAGVLLLSMPCRLIINFVRDL